MLARLAPATRLISLTVWPLAGLRGVEEFGCGEYITRSGRALVVPPEERINGGFKQMFINPHVFALALRAIRVHRNKSISVFDQNIEFPNLHYGPLYPMNRLRAREL